MGNQFQATQSNYYRFIQMGQAHYCSNHEGI